jgi:hypothetical protein
LLGLPGGVKTTFGLGGDAALAGGLTAKELQQEYLLRDLLGSGHLGTFGENIKSGPGVDKIPYMDMITGKMGKPGEAVNWVGKKWSNLNDIVFQRGMKAIEDPARAAVANAYLNRVVETGKRAAPEQLDAAVAHAKDFLFDYSPESLTQAERVLKNFFPFMGWNSSILRRTIKDIGLQPQRLANQGRFYDAVLDPYTEEERSQMPKWMQEGGPAKGILGYQPKGENGENIVLQAGRFIPQGNVEQMMSSPGETALGLLSPWIKGPEEATGNWSHFKRRSIDPLAGGGFEALVNPITKSGPYALADQVTMGARLPAMYQYLLETMLPTSRYLSTLNTLASNVAFENPYAMPMTGGQRLGWALTGGKEYPLDEGRARYYRVREQQRTELTAKAAAKRAAAKGDYYGQEFYFDQLMGMRERSTAGPLPFR